IRRFPVAGETVAGVTKPIPVFSIRDRIMSTGWQDRSSKAKSRPMARDRRTGRNRRVGDARLVSVFSRLVNGQLQVDDTNDVDPIALDHVGTNPIIDGASYADADIAAGILITGGMGVGRERASGPGRRAFVPRQQETNHGHLLP